MQSRPEEGLHGFPDGGGDVHTSAASAGANEVYLTNKKIRPACKISSAATRTVVMDAVHESHELQELDDMKSGLLDRPERILLERLTLTGTGRGGHSADTYLPSGHFLIFFHRFFSKFQDLSMKFINFWKLFRIYRNSDKFP